MKLLTKYALKKSANGSNLQVTQHLALIISDSFSNTIETRRRPLIQDLKQGQFVFYYSTL